MLAGRKREWNVCEGEGLATWERLACTIERGENEGERVAGRKERMFVVLQPGITLLALYPAIFAYWSGRRERESGMFVRGLLTWEKGAYGCECTIEGGKTWESV